MASDPRAAAAAAASSAAAAASPADAADAGDIDLPAVMDEPAMPGGAPDYGGVDSLGSELGLTAPGLSSKEGASDELTPIEQLRQFWINERAAPELLAYEGEVISFIRGVIDRRTQEIRQQQGKPEQGWLCTILSMEVERLMYMVNSYHRCRLKKIEMYAPYLLAKKEIHEKGSPAEIQFCKGFVDLLHAHLHGSFLQNLPPKMQAWIDAARPDEMLERPDTANSFVVFRVKADIEEYIVPSQEDPVTLREGDLVIGSWAVYGQLFREGLIDLL